MTDHCSIRRLFHVMSLALVLPLPGMAVDLEVRVINTKGEPVHQAVITARPVQGELPPGVPEDAVIDQVDREFVPSVTAIYRGASVSFPNSDSVRHHVYSFSNTRIFEIPLYANQPVPPVRFDQAGVVALGCNVHDWMSAHVFVSDTPYFAVTDALGNARLTPLPAGEYAVDVWHAQLRGKPESLRQIVIVEDRQVIDFRIAQRRAWKAWRATDDFGEGY